MACQHPIIIRNRRYFNQPEDYVASQLLLHPEDVARQYLRVPCGKCPECRRIERNNWYVRLNRELAFQNRRGGNAYFITITINPKYYENAYKSPSEFIRMFFERIRHTFGKSIKHAVFQEFSPEKRRLHFHGVLFGSRIDFRRLHSIIKDLGFIWICRANSRTIRYVVKYVTKSIEDWDRFGEECDKRFRRKFVSAHVGDDIVGMPNPTFDCRSWSYYDIRTGRTFTYSIPRYYDRYLSETEKRKRSAQAGLLSAISDHVPFAAAICMEVLQELFQGHLPDQLTPIGIEKSLRRLAIRDRYIGPAVISDPEVRWKRMLVPSAFCKLNHF